MSDNLYKYIRRNKSGYVIVKDNEDYGSYSRLSDALYERDRLVKADWDWDALMELAETDNPYEKIHLPMFIHEYSYIYRKPQSYMICKDGECWGTTNGKQRAYKLAESIGGEVVEKNVVYIIKKKINGVSKYFGSFKTLEEAKKRKDELVEKGWIE